MRVKGRRSAVLTSADPGGRQRHRREPLDRGLREQLRVGLGDDRVELAPLPRRQSSQWHMIVIIGSAVGVCVISGCAAYAMARLDLPGANGVMLYLLMAVALPMPLAARSNRATRFWKFTRLTVI